MSVEQLAEYFEYLDNLRESGEINMFGAASHIVSQFEIPQDEARQILLSWMDTFDDTSALERARLWLNQNTI